MNEPDSSSFPSLNEVEKIIGYEFKNKELLKEAFTHNSYKDNNCQSYDRLEYLGDSFLNHIIAKEHFFQYPRMKSGELTQLRAANVDNEALARVAFKHGLHRFLRHQDPLLEGRVQELMEGIKQYPLHSHGLINSPKILADILESLIGAVYVDTNLSIDATWEVVKSLLQPLTTPENLKLNPMTKLNETCQKIGIKLEYKNSWVETGEIEIYNGNELIGKGNYKKKKATAKNKAAADAYVYLVKQLGLKDDTDFDEL
uniref:Ribonuclease 3-like protein 3 n=1 Tax=Tanacetum cinerariifolium TaxID=118510 RepID=A0A699GJY1_TANCI|nr:ribonuclease 3-like protein 3 [Tanacetum cinerariifolium]